jgi:hypothetical protein
MGKKSRSGPGSYFRKLRKTFWVKFFDADPGSFEPGSGMEKFGSGINIPDPHHWLLVYPKHCSGSES